MPQKILLVCLGNICRSPAAEGILRAKAGARGLPILFDSCGTGNWHAGHPPYGPMQAAARARGYDLGPLRARQLRATDFTRFDLILGMDSANLRDIHAAAPNGATGQIARFLPDRDVPDPYYSGDFDTALDLIEAGADRLLAKLDAP